MRFVAAARVVGAGLASAAAALAITRAAAGAGYDGAPALAGGLAVLVVGGVLAGLVVRPRLTHVAALAAILTAVLAAAWQPSGEAAPSERSMDLRALVGCLLVACVVASAWSIGVAVGRHLRPRHE